MSRGPPKAALVLSEEERENCCFVRNRSLASSLSNRARIILASADGEPNRPSPRACNLTRHCARLAHVQHLSPNSERTTH
jgi:putative transposase